MGCLSCFDIGTTSMPRVGMVSEAGVVRDPNRNRTPSKTFLISTSECSRTLSCVGAGIDLSNRQTSLSAVSRLAMLAILHGSVVTPDLHLASKNAMAITSNAMATKRPSATRIKPPDFLNPYAHTLRKLVLPPPQSDVNSRRSTSLEMGTSTRERVPRIVLSNGSGSLNCLTKRKLTTWEDKRLGFRDKQSDSFAVAPPGNPKARNGSMQLRLEAKTCIGMDKTVVRRTGMTDTIK